VNMQAGSFQEPWEVSVGEEGKGHSMQKGQRQKRCGNQHCGKSRKTIMNGEGAKLKTATETSQSSAHITFIADCLFCTELVLLGASGEIQTEE